MRNLEELAKAARVTVRRAGPSNTEGRCLIRSRWRLRIPARHAWTAKPQLVAFGEVL